MRHLGFQKLMWLLQGHTGVRRRLMSGLLPPVQCHCSCHCLGLCLHPGDISEREQESTELDSLRLAPSCATAWRVGGGSRGERTWNAWLGAGRRRALSVPQFQLVITLYFSMHTPNVWTPAPPFQGTGPLCLGSVLSFEGIFLSTHLVSGI